MQWNGSTQFIKYQSLGNDFVLFDWMSRSDDEVAARVESPKWSHQVTGALARRLLGGGPLAQRAMKEMAVRTRHMATLEAIRFGETMRHVAATTQDASEGFQAAAENRPPRWTGR